MIDMKRISLEPGKRVIVISDIHANLQLFKKLLDRVNYQLDDYLFINGDLCEKGDNSLEVVEFVRSLQQSSSNVFIVKGNCDVVHRYVFQESEGIIPYMKSRKSILNEMLAKNNKRVEEFNSVKHLSTYYKAHFQDIIDWLEALPVAYETDDFIIIHAGIDPKTDWKQTDEKTALYTSSFLDKSHQAGKPVIVGHWPVINYRATDVSSHNPLVDLEKNIIAIDGGNQLKQDGQLNALIIQDGTYSYTFVDSLNHYIIIEHDHKAGFNRTGTVTYPNYELKIMKRGAFFTRCQNVILGTEQWIKNEYIIEKNDSILCKTDVSTTFLSVKRGEKVWVVDDTCEGYILVKNENGEIGWIER